MQSTLNLKIKQVMHTKFVALLNGRQKCLMQSHLQIVAQPSCLKFGSTVYGKYT